MILLVKLLLRVAEPREVQLLLGHLKFLTGALKRHLVFNAVLLMNLARLDDLGVVQQLVDRRRVVLPVLNADKVNVFALMSRGEGLSVAYLARDDHLVAVVGALGRWDDELGVCKSGGSSGLICIEGHMVERVLVVLRDLHFVVRVAEGMV